MNSSARTKDVGKYVSGDVRAPESENISDQMGDGEEFYRRLFESNPHPVWVYDLETLQFLVVNQKAARHYGYSREELLGMKISDIRPPEDLPLLLEYIAEANETNRELTHRVRHRKKDGTVIFVEVAAHPITFAGRRARLVIATDVTERSRIEAELRHSETEMRTIFSAMTDIILVLDAAGCFLKIAPTNLNALYKPLEQFVGKNIGELFAPEQAKMILGYAHRCLAVQAAINVEYPLSIQNQEMWFAATVTPLSDRATLWVARDVTERKRMEAQLKEARDAALAAAQLKSEFLANISHEIRTPMNGIIGMTDLLLDDGAEPLAAEQRERAETIKVCADALLTIINEVLDFSKIEAGKLRFDVDDFDLRQTVNDSVRLLAEKAAEKNLSLTTEIDSAVSVAMRGDAGRLRQVLINLLSNAVKFTERGAVAVSIVQTAETEKTQTLKFVVRDTGIGIDRAAGTRLFEPFSQADASTTRRFGGTGLGLAISKQIVEMMGGEIDFESAPGAGSAFWFTAEFEKKHPAPTPHEQPPRSLIAKTIQTSFGARVLLVEDNSVNTKIAVEYLKKLGCRADAAGDGRQALAALKKGFYDLVLMDCQMPEMDGYEATRKIRAREQADDSASRRRIPVVAMTANALAGDRERCLAAGMDDYLSKPIRLKQLSEILTRFCAADGSPPQTKETPQNEIRLGDADVSGNGEPVSRETLLGFAALEADNPGFVVELATLYLEDAKQNVQSLQASVKNNDLRSAALAAHKLTGSSATFGAQRTAALSRRLQQACAAGDIDSAIVLAQEIIEEFSRVEKFLRNNFLSVPFKSI